MSGAKQPLIAQLPPGSACKTFILYVLVDCASNSSQLPYFHQHIRIDPTLPFVINNIPAWNVKKLNAFRTRG